MALRKIHLHGFLGKKYGKEFNFAVSTAGEAVRALIANFPSIAEDFKIGEWRVVRGKDTKKGLHLELEDINAFNLGMGELHFIPHAAGSKRRGLVKTVIGVALVGAAVIASGGTLAGMAAPLLGGMFTAGNLGMMGLALTVSGVASLLSPKQHPANSQNLPADVMIGPVNTYEQGNPVPLVYGEVTCGSVVVSSGLTLTPFSMINTAISMSSSGAALLGSGITTGGI